MLCGVVGRIEPIGMMAMIETSARRPVEFRTATLAMWGSVTVSIGICLWIAYVAKARGMPRANLPFAAQLYSPGLVIISLVVLALSCVIDRVVLSAGPSGIENSDQGRSPDSRLRILYIAQIAVFESVAVIGLVHFFLGGTLTHLVHFCIMSFVLMGILLLKLPS